LANVSSFLSVIGHFQIWQKHVRFRRKHAVSSLYRRPFVSIGERFFVFIGHVQIWQKHVRFRQKHAVSSFYAHRRPGAAVLVGRGNTTAAKKSSFAEFQQPKFCIRLRH
jgi:hypothetical protein